MTLNGLVPSLRKKAEEVLASNYGDPDYPGQDEEWIGDLNSAAGKIKRGTLWAITKGEMEEIDALSDDSHGFDLLRQDIRRAMRDGKPIGGRYQ